MLKTLVRIINIRANKAARAAAKQILMKILFYRMGCPGALRNLNSLKMGRISSEFNRTRLVFSAENKIFQFRHVSTR